MVKKKNDSKKENKQENQKNSMKLIGFAVFLIFIFLVSFYYFKDLKESKNFVYEGLDFTETEVANIPVFHHYYYYTSREDVFTKYNLYLRLDPRENEVPVRGGEIEFFPGKFAYISIGEGVSQCEYGGAAVGSLTNFLNDNEVITKGAVPDQEMARESGLRYATCQTHPNNPVILIQGGEEETFIQKIGNCYLIEVNNCEILEAVEKFEVQTILDGKARIAESN